MMDIDLSGPAQVRPEQPRGRHRMTRAPRFGGRLGLPLNGPGRLQQRNHDFCRLLF